MQVEERDLERLNYCSFVPIQNAPLKKKVSPWTLCTSAERPRRQFILQSDPHDTLHYSEKCPPLQCNEPIDLCLGLCLGLGGIYTFTPSRHA